MKKILLFFTCLYLATACDDPESLQLIRCPDGYCDQIFYGDASNQWLLMHQAESDNPTPVYVWAHTNGSSPSDPGSARNVNAEVVNDCIAAGISFISWESVGQVQNDVDLIQTENDFALMMTWLLEHAAEYNIDVNKIVVGGGSRGTVATWPRMKEFRIIKGFYGVQAFPDNGWLVRDYTTYIDSESPRVQLMYRDAPGTTDTHKPENGIRIVDRYFELGIGERTYLEHSVAENSLYRDIVSFIEECIQ
jgi:hypothetical protein